MVFGVLGIVLCDTIPFLVGVLLAAMLLCFSVLSVSIAVSFTSVMIVFNVWPRTIRMSNNYIMYA